MKNNFWEPIDTIRLTDSRFDETLNTPDGYYYLSDGTTDIKLYLEPGMDLALAFDADDVISSVLWKGKGEAENNYLASKSRLTDQIPIKARVYSEYGQLDEQKFLLQTDSLEKSYLSHFEANQPFNKRFTFLEEHAIKIEKSIRLSQFESIKRMVTKNPDYKVSHNYPDPYSNVDLNNPLLMKTYGYKDIMQNYVSSLVGNSEDFSETADFFLLFQKELNKSNLAPEIRDKLGLENSTYGFTYTKDPEEYYQEYMSFATIEAYRKEFQQRYHRSKTEKGSPSPDFRFQGSDEKWYSLKDFKRKYVYIDLWASWCAPCITQMPHLKKLKDKYAEKIHFVSIAWNDRKESWKKMIDKENLSGYQLYAPEKEADFFTFYNVSGIPRFILLDKEGKIIESIAKQPSEKSLDKQLDQLE
ncbi:MAG: TlpA disulfide reductase family protein [Cyclobacteriaceae bacterium]